MVIDEIGPNANLKFANLEGVNLIDTNLRGSNLEGADLRGANLMFADLRHTNLRGSNLEGADLRGANLYGADVRGTCLAGISGVTPAALVWDGWKVEDGWVYGIRTSRSQHVGSTKYRPGEAYEAPYLSVDRGTECHPGIYFCRDVATLDDTPRVRVRARCTDVVWTAKGLRCKRLEVLGSR